MGLMETVASGAVVPFPVINIQLSNGQETFEYFRIKVPSKDLLSAMLKCAEYFKRCC